MKALLAALFILACTLVTHASCSVDYVRISEIKGPGYIDVGVENLVTAELTITWTLDQAENVRTDRPLPATAVIGGRQKAIAFRILLPRDDRVWRYHFAYRLRMGNMNAQHDDSAVYRLPYAAGQTFKVIQGFNGTFSHTGNSANAIDWAMPVGTEVHAARGGVVMYTRDEFTEGGPDRGLLECSNQVIVRHPDGTYGEYDHLDTHGVRVKAGDRVAAGDLLGYSGFTGFTSTPHLHFMVYRPRDGSHNDSIPVRYTVAGSNRPVILEQGQTYSAP